MTSTDIGAFAREQRTRLQLTQQELADVAGVSDRFVRELEGGKPSVQMDKVQAVLAVLGFDLVPQLHDAELNAKFGPAWSQSLHSAAGPER